MTSNRPAGGLCDAGRRTTSVGLLAVVTVFLAGCSGSSEQREAEDAATGFVAALSSPAAACALLAPGTRTELMDQSGSSCAAALAEENLPATAATVTSVSVAGHSAQVVLGDQVIFLARFDDGWRVTAAGCSRTSADVSSPYNCTVKGS